MTYFPTMIHFVTLPDNVAQWRGKLVTASDISFCKLIKTYLLQNFMTILLKNMIFSDSNPQWR